MKLKNILVTIGAIGLGLALTGGVTAAASTSYVNAKSGNFLIAKKKIVLAKTKYKKAFTILKGTIVQISGVTTLNGKRIMDIQMNSLSYHLRKSYVGKNETSTRNIVMKKTNFKKVSVPQYLRYYSTQKSYPENIGLNATQDGSLFAGLKYPDANDESTAKAARIHVSSDGYLEYYANTDVFSVGVDPKPTTSVKVTKAALPSGSGKTYLYTKQAVPSAIGKRISKSGSAQYLTVIKRQYTTYTTTYTTERNKDVTSSVHVSCGYLVNGTHYYMPTAIFFPQSN
ncbi:hypothetical protein [Levilactobacillus wangkuiensis]|uniref:hypothetical protein n=1 Tax=Levilactobacillus wangkuiensis TaxID=2799566 RepID=UPI001944A50C|nr:hypothetical protein [Levilactobacillus wangkuiensis]